MAREVAVMAEVTAVAKAAARAVERAAAREVVAREAGAKAEVMEVVTAEARAEPPDPRFLSQGLPPLDPASSPGVGAPNTFLLQIQQLKQQIQLI